MINLEQGGAITVSGFEPFTEVSLTLSDCCSTFEYTIVADNCGRIEILGYFFLGFRSGVYQIHPNITINYTA
jgi:hypothetical protein